MNLKENLETRQKLLCKFPLQNMHGRIYWGGGVTPPRISLSPLINCSTPPKFRFTPPILCESLQP
jgi:hypothetical protein